MGGTPQDARHTVALAGLLHDIGKVMNRAREVVELRRELDTTHPALADWFVNHLAEHFEDAPLVATLVRHHHEGQHTRAYLHVDSISDPELRTLARIVSRADSFSAGERPDEGRREGGPDRHAALENAFGRLGLTGGPRPDSGFYALRAADPNNMFPEGRATHEDAEIADHLHGFAHELRKALEECGSDDLRTLAAVCEKWLWCVPSDTTKQHADISLYDHMRMTSAIATCAYVHHLETGTLTDDMVVDDAAPRWLLLGADLSGIQAYLYGVAAIGAGKVAKRLRARSFSLFALMVAASEMVRDRLDLPSTCNLMCSGGQFFVLCPNTQSARSALGGLRREINGWLLQALQGELALTMAWTELTGEDFARGQYAQAVQRVKDRLNQEKRRKFLDCLPPGGVVAEDYAHGACAVCRKFPASGASEDENERICDWCARDEDLGTAVASGHFITLGGTAREGHDLEWFGDPALTIGVRGAMALSSSLRSAIYMLGPELSFVKGRSSEFRYVNNYVPRFTQPQQLQERCELCPLQPETCDVCGTYVDQSGQLRGEPVQSFQCLAAAACGGAGEALIGVLRADVDNLGLLFSMGLEPDTEGEPSYVSPSRVATLSRMTEAFFAGYTRHLIGGLDNKGAGEFANVYCTYAGGDDLMMVGPWDVMIRLAGRLNAEFRKFAGGNPDVTLSAGIEVVKPKTPIWWSAQEAGKRLDTAKEVGRDRFAVLGSVAVWDQFEELLGLGETYATWAASPAGGSPRVPRAFFYRLLQYADMAARGHEADPRNALWRSKLAYDLGRNFCDKNGKPKDEEVHREFLRLIEPGGERLMQHLRFPISYAVLATRGRKQ